MHRSCAHRRTLCHRAPRGKAASYTLALWNKLTRFLEYPELELSNNLAENSMRPIAIGRKNWIHIGSAQAGPKVAAIFLPMPAASNCPSVLSASSLAALPSSWAARETIARAMASAQLLPSRSA